MLKNQILLTCKALVLLTAMQRVKMYIECIAEMRTKFIRAKAFAAERLHNNL